MAVSDNIIGTGVRATVLDGHLVHRSEDLA